MPQDRPNGLRLSIPRLEAEEILTHFLDGEKFPKPRDYAHRWLEDLLKYHLIQVKLVGTDQEIEFRHQLIQEYYAAEYLLPLFPNLTDIKLQHSYLNYLDWTESLALMLELVEGEEQAVRVVRLALEVDLRLGARLAGAVKYGFQEKTVGLLVDQDYLPPPTISYLLGLTCSEKAIPYLKDQLTSSLCQDAIKALGKIPTQATIDTLKHILDESKNNANEMFHGEIALTLGKTGLPSAGLLLDDWNRREEEKGEEVGYLKIRIETALWDVYGDDRKPVLFQQIVPDYDEQDFEREYGEVSLDNLLRAIEEISVCYYDDGADFAVKKLTNYADEDLIPKLTKIVASDNPSAKELALKMLIKKRAKDILHILVKATNDMNFSVRKTAVWGLVLIDRNSVDTLLILITKALFDKDSSVRQTAIAGLAEIRNQRADLCLFQAICDHDRNVREEAILALGKIGSDKCCEVLAILFRENYSSIYDIGNIVNALLETGREEFIDLLVSKFYNDYSLSTSVVNALGNSGREDFIDLLASKLNREDHSISKDIIEAFGKIGGDKAIKILIQLFKYKEFDMYGNVVEALKKISETDRNLPILTQQLPHLLTLIPTESSQQALSVITAIQARCKYYNYDIAQTPLPPEDNPNPTTRNTYNFYDKVGKVVGGNLIVQGDNIATQNTPKTAPES